MRSSNQESEDSLAAAIDHRVKTRVIGYSEIEERFNEIVTALEGYPLDEEFIREKGTLLAFALDLCISQMNAPNSGSYPEKSAHLANLKKAQEFITYKVNACTVDEISSQVTAAYRAFAVQ